MAWKGEVEDGTGWDGLVASKSEQRAEARQAALEKDAARYRWLRDKGSDTWAPFTGKWEMDAQHCDAAIDNEMAKQRLFGAA